MKISIITTTFNSARTVRDTLQSVATQSWGNIEHIIVDGASTDETLDIVRQFSHVKKIICEPDKGIYDAINKGIQASTGEIIGILNSDDFLSSNQVIENIASAFKPDIDAIFGDVAFVKETNLQKTVRYYSSSVWRPALFRWGFMPAHPSFYVRKKCYDKFGLYKLHYRIAADYELLIRMLKVKQIKYKYIQMQFVTMRLGGVSTKNVKSRLLLNQEIVQGCKENGIYTNLLMLSLKYSYKVFEYLLSSRRQI